tara:strand:- start:417 stop:794 length:378 start_codon:yes stop_codon:yes gene_type:complete
MKRYLIEYVWEHNSSQSSVCKIVINAWSEDHAREILSAQKILSVEELPKESRLDLEAYRKDIIKCASALYEKGKTMDRDEHLKMWDYHIQYCVDLIHNAYKGGLLDAMDKQKQHDEEVSDANEKR